MELSVKTLDGASAGNITVSDSLFGLDPRTDILYRCVRWQLAKRQQGTHQAQQRATIDRTTRKMYKQKGTGNARHGSAKAPQFRGGGKAHSPIARSHEHDLPKQIRALALRHALSAKAKNNAIVVLDQAVCKDPKTKGLVGNLDKLGVNNALFIDGVEIQDNFKLAARNIPNIDVLPIQGINVYDILRRKTLVLTRAAVDALEARFK